MSKFSNLLKAASRLSAVVLIAFLAIATPYWTLTTSDTDAAGTFSFLAGMIWAVLSTSLLDTSKLSGVIKLIFGIALFVLSGWMMSNHILSGSNLGALLVFGILFQSAAFTGSAFRQYFDQRNALKVVAQQAASPLDGQSESSKVSEATKPARRFSHYDPDVRKTVEGFQAETVCLPLSRGYAMLAGALKAREDGKDEAAVNASARKMAELWAIPHGTPYTYVDNAAIKSSAIWERLHFEAASQLMGATAAFLRHLENNKSVQEAEVAAERAFKQWAPQTVNRSALRSDPISGDRLQFAQERDMVNIQGGVTYQIRVLSWYSWLLGTTAWLVVLFNVALHSFALIAWTMLTVGTIVFMRKAKHGFLKTILTLVGFVIVCLVLYVLFEVVMSVDLNLEKIPLEILSLFGCTLAAFLTARLIGGTMRAAEKRASADFSKVEEAKRNPAVAAKPAITSLEDPAAQEWVQWALTHAPNPRSRMYAAIAGAIRALEMGKDHAAIEQAALATAKAWAAPPNVKLHQVGDDVLSVDNEPWAPPRATALSQLVATRAGYLRALELGSDKAAAIEAARKTLQRWIPQHPQSEGARNGGESRGIVYGYLRRSERVSLGAHPLLRGTLVSMDKEVWTFTIKREGNGSNGRPLSPIQIRIEGSAVTGALEDGDLVELPRPPIAAEINAYGNVRNLSKGVDILAKPIAEDEKYKSYHWQRVLVPLIGFLIFGIIAYAMISDFNKRTAAIQQMFPH